MDVFKSGYSREDIIARNAYTREATDKYKGIDPSKAAALERLRQIKSRSVAGIPEKPELVRTSNPLAPPVDGEPETPPVIYVQQRESAWVYILLAAILLVVLVELFKK
jgi:hypothetical protein